MRKQEETQTSAELENLHSHRALHPAKIQSTTIIITYIYIYSFYDQLSLPVYQHRSMRFISDRIQFDIELCLHCM